jgi:nucleotide sugar dehydrogenase
MSTEIATTPLTATLNTASKRTLLTDQEIVGLPRPEFTFDVAIVGLGYVGLPTALALHTAGSRVLGLDVSHPRLTAIRTGQADLLKSDQDRLAEAMRHDGFHLSGDTFLLGDAAAVIVCVPTPVDEHLVPDLTILRRACAMVVEAALPGQLLMLTSTTYAGCSQDMLVAPLEARGFTVGEDIFVAFSPERIDPGNDNFSHEEVPRVVGGATDACAQVAGALLGSYAKNIHPVASLEVAEMSKLLENTFRAVNIALANEFAEACQVIGVPVMEVIAAASTKPYGFMPFFPGAGVGGHCIPCDPHYLLWQLRKEHVAAPVIEHAMAGIAGRPRRVVERVRQTLADQGVPLQQARILIVGVSYKKDVADLRESPALEILNLLQALGSDVGYYDDHFANLALPDGSLLAGITDPAGFDADLVLLHTDHSLADWSWLADTTPVLDTTYRKAGLSQRVLL